VIDDRARVVQSNRRLNKLIFKNSKADEVFRAENDFDVLEKKILRVQDSKDKEKEKLSVTDIITFESSDHDGKTVYEVDCEHEQDSSGKEMLVKNLNLTILMPSI
jgi:hypothetical protein